MTTEQLDEFADWAESVEGMVYQLCVEQSDIPSINYDPDTPDEFVQLCSLARVTKALVNIHRYAGRALDIDRRVNA